MRKKFNSLCLSIKSVFGVNLERFPLALDLSGHFGLLKSISKKEISPSNLLNFCLISY